MTVDRKRKAPRNTTRRRSSRTTNTPPPAPPPTISLSAYARHRGCSTEAVRKAIARGRLVKSVTQEDPPQVLDVQLADQEWAANTDLTRAHIDVRAAAERPRCLCRGERNPDCPRHGDPDPNPFDVAPPSTDASIHVITPPGRETERGRVLRFDEPQAHGGSLKREQLEVDVSIAAASAAEKHWRSKKAELDYKKAAGELVDAKDVTARFVELITTSRTKLLGLPSKAKAQLPHLTIEDLNTLDAIVREALEELAS